MGHTLVAVFSEESKMKLRKLLKEAGAEDSCKIPYRSGCDRAAANNIMEHHITLYHWAKANDAVYLERLRSLHDIDQSSVTVVKPVLLKDKESYVICLEVAASEHFSEMMCSVGKKLGMAPGNFLHITLDATRDCNRAKLIYNRLKGMKCFPFKLDIGGLVLYKIWRPVELVKRYPIRRK